MLRRSIRQWFAFLLWLVSSGGALAAGASFSDPAMNLPDYVFSSYPQGGTVTVSQTSSGNPGAALKQVISVATPISATDHTETYFINRNFLYDPATQGAVGTIQLSIDKSVTPSPSGIAWGNGQGFILEQAGRYFETDVGLASVPATFQTASTLLLRPENFYLLPDPVTHIGDASVHPDFSAGVMRFGIFNGLGVPVGAPDLQMSYVFDNFKVSIQPVPEPAAAALWLSGLALLLPRLMRRRTRALAATAASKHP